MSQLKISNLEAFIFIDGTLFQAIFSEGLLSNPMTSMLFKLPLDYFM